jgi:hypothetical protein
VCVCVCVTTLHTHQASKLGVVLLLLVSSPNALAEKPEIVGAHTAVVTCDLSNSAAVGNLGRSFPVERHGNRWRERSTDSPIRPVQPSIRSQNSSSPQPARVFDRVYMDCCSAISRGFFPLAYWRDATKLCTDMIERCGLSCVMLWYGACAAQT